MRRRKSLLGLREVVLLEDDNPTGARQGFELAYQFVTRFGSVFLVFVPVFGSKSFLGLRVVVHLEDYGPTGARQGFEPAYLRAANRKEPGLLLSRCGHRPYMPRVFASLAPRITVESGVFLSRLMPTSVAPSGILAPECTRQFLAVASRKEVLACNLPSQTHDTRLRRRRCKLCSPRLKAAA